MKMARLNRIEPGEDGVVSVRFSKETYTKREGPWHRTAIAPGADFEVMKASINEHLIEMHNEPVSDAEWEKVRAAVNKAHTPELVAAARARQSEG